jgi:hypothetical protein
MLPKFVQELFTSRKNYGDGETRVGQAGRLWYENDTNSIRISDGVRPGGRIVAGGVWYNNTTNSLMWTDPDTDIEYVIATAGPRAANQLTNGTVSLTLNADGTVSFPNYTFPAEDGSPNQVLVTDGSGNLSWQDQTGSGGGGNSHVTVSDTAPINPAAGDLWYDSTAGRTYIYYGDAWVDSNPSGTTRATVGTVAPTTAYIGDLWYNSDSGRTYIYYNNTWVDSNPQGDFRVKIGNTAPRRPIAGDLWYNTLVHKTLIYVDGDWVDANPPGTAINKLIDIPDVYTGGPGDPMLVDGVTLIYAAGQERWETKPIDTAQINLDGGGY